MHTELVFTRSFDTWMELVEPVGFKWPEILLFGEFGDGRDFWITGLSGNNELSIQEFTRK